jgi:hypothetical protein
MTDRPALYTTVHPGVRKYLADWYASARTQTDQNFDLWIGVDGLGISDVQAAMKGDIDAHWVLAEPGDSPAEIRRRAISQLLERHATVIFVDSDDVLAPSRVAAAVGFLERSDVTGCAMRLIGEQGRDLNIRFGPEDEAKAVAQLARCNVFGLGNTAYRSNILRRCLPIPADCELVDWYLATRARAEGAQMSFDMTCRASYRRHAASMAPVVGPFSEQQILAAARLVVRHYGFVVAGSDGFKEGLGREFRAEVLRAKDTAQRFLAAAETMPGMLHRYTSALNELPPEPVWWSCVARKELETLWN